MERKKWIAPTILVLALAGGALSGCVLTGDGEQGVEFIEGMTDLEFSKWKIYIQLGVKVGANRMLEEGTVTEEELDIAAAALEAVRDEPIIPGAASLIMPALAEAGLTNDEVQLLLLIVEQELLSRGALEWVDPETGVISLSPRTKELLTVVADSLRAAELLTDEEFEQGLVLEAEYNGKIIE